MPKIRTYSRYTEAAIILLGKQIHLARKQHKWSESELAERAGISRTTVQKIEKGDTSCEIGLVFETAVLVGLKLFDSETTSLDSQTRRADEIIALLPKSTHRPKQKVDDNF